MLHKKAMVSLIVLVGLSLVSASIIGYVIAEEEPRPLLVIIKARGIAVDVDTQEIMLAGQITICVALEPKTNNLTLIPLFVLGGVVRIGPFDYNITAGRGVMIVQRHVLKLFCNGTTPEGEDFTYRLFGRFIRTPDGLRLIRFIGMFETEDTLRYVLFFLGKPRLVLPPQ